MILDLNIKSKGIRVKMNITKTKYPTNELLDRYDEITEVEKYIYLSQKIELSNHKLKTDFDRQTFLTLAEFG